MSPRTINHILNALPQDAFERLAPDLKKTDLPHGKYLYHPNQPIRHIYFPEYAMASIVATTANGQTAEVGVVGFEGAVGLDVLMGADSVPLECMIQIPNGGWRIAVDAVKKEFARGDGLQQLALRSMHKLVMQISQTALCNSLHSIEQRLARWLLLCHDRVEGDKINLTQEFLSTMLGVTRTSVTLSATALQNLGYIKYSRGTINVVDRAGLEEFSCECYSVVKREYDRK